MKVVIVAKYSHNPCSAVIATFIPTWNTKENILKLPTLQKASVYNNMTHAVLMTSSKTTAQVKADKSQVQWTLRRIISGGHLEIKTDFTYTVSNAISQEKPNELPTFWRTKHYLQNVQNIFYIVDQCFIFLKNSQCKKTSCLVCLKNRFT